MKKIEKFFNNIISHYNHDKYWKIKFKLHNENYPIFMRYYYLLRLKRMDAFNGASLGNRVNGGSTFESAPFFPHGIKGIFITDSAKIGKNCTILQQVTIGLKKLEDSIGPHIGDNVFIGSGAKIIGNIKIGNNVKIGAKCVVVEDIPDGATVVMNKPKIIVKK